MVEKIHELTGVILAGGLSTRIGRDKGQLKIGELSLSDRSFKNMDRIFSDLVYVINDPRAAPEHYGITLAKDEIPHLGPLGGILAGLRAAKTDRIFVVGYDMPFVLPELVRLIASYNTKADVVVPEIGGRFEPLHAVYDRTCIPVIASQLQAGDNKIISFYEKVEVTAVPEEKVLKIDPELVSFFNINTWDDVKQAERIFRNTEQRTDD